MKYAVINPLDASTGIVHSLHRTPQGALTEKHSLWAGGFGAQAVVLDAKAYRGDRIRFDHLTVLTPELARSL